MSPNSGRKTPSATSRHEQQRCGPQRHPAARRADRAGRRRAAAPPHQRAGDAHEDDREAHQRRAPERPQAEAAALVQADALRDDLGQQRVVVEAVRRHHLAAVPADVHGPLVRRRVERVADHREDPVRRPAGSATVIGCRSPCRSATAMAVSTFATLRSPSCARRRPGHPRVALRPGHVLVAVRQRLVQRGRRVGLRARVQCSTSTSRARWRTTAPSRPRSRSTGGPRPAG